jgi:deazaflavin-dependent oxidoreductase (nitroreductase family)
MTETDSPPPYGPDEARPRLGRRMARFNLLVINRLTLRIARRAPGFGIVIHKGRRSGRTYRTPVLVFRSPGEYVIALTYGRDRQWVKNVLAQGGCRLVSRGSEIELTAPEIFHDRQRRAVPIVVRFVLSAVRVEDFLRLSAVRQEIAQQPPDRQARAR